MPVVRDFTPADLEPVRAIFNHVIARGDAFVYDAPLSPADFQAYRSGYPHAYVAVADHEPGKVLGAYFLRPNQPGRGAHVANGTYLVSPDARGQGVGRLLGEHSIGEARRLGYAAVQFNAVVASNRSAVQLWHGLGFRTVGTIPRAFRLPDGTFSDLLVMFREI